jgi:hypothetical protein
MILNSVFNQPLDVPGCAVVLQFRQATNGVIVNTFVDGEPLVTTSAGTFKR